MDCRKGWAQDFLLSLVEKLKLLGKVRFRQKIALSGKRPPHLCQCVEGGPLQTTTGRSTGTPTKRSVSQRFHAKIGANHGGLDPIFPTRQTRSRSYISANEIPTAEMSVAITNVTSSLSRVVFHRTVPPHPLVIITLLTMMTSYRSASDCRTNSYRLFRSNGWGCTVGTRATGSGLRSRRLNEHWIARRPAAPSGKPLALLTIFAFYLCLCQTGARLCDEKRGAGRGVVVRGRTHS